MDQLIEFSGNNILLVAALFVVIALLAKSFLDSRGINAIKPIRAVELINRDNAVVLDVRMDDEFKSGHILNSKHIPLGLLSNQIKDLEHHRDQPIVISCRSGSRARSASSMLRRAGFAKLYVLDGGITAWQNASLPLQRG